MVPQKGDMPFEGHINWIDISKLVQKLLIANATTLMKVRCMKKINLNFFTTKPWYRTRLNVQSINLNWSILCTLILQTANFLKKSCISYIQIYERSPFLSDFVDCLRHWDLKEGISALKSLETLWTAFIHALQINLVRNRSKHLVFSSICNKKAQKSKT